MNADGMDDDLGPEVGYRLVPEIGGDQIIPAEAVFDALAADPDDIERSEVDEDYDEDPALDEIQAMADEPDEAERAAGRDTTLGNDQLHHWWTKGPGLARWVNSPTPWRTLLANLVDEVEGKPLETLKKWTSRWFIEVFGFAAGSDLNRVTHGKPPRGDRIGPG